MVDAELLLTSGIGMSMAAKQLVDLAGEDSFNGPTSGAVFLLLGNAVELTFKAVAVSLGAGEADLKRAGHSLIDARDAAIERGFDVPKASAVYALVEVLQETHVSNHFRYLGGPTEVRLPEPQVIFPVLDELIAEAARFLGLPIASGGSSAGQHQRT